jgi:two-component system nitrate/nitrite response regulator NarL
MNWTQPINTNTVRRMSVGVCDTQPIVVEGLKSCLAGSGLFALGDSAKTLEEAARVVITSSPQIMVLDKALGGPAVLDWVTRMAQVCPGTSFVVWGASMTESEALRFLKGGAKGIIRKSAEIGSVLSCLETVAGGCTWMEESLFREGAQGNRETRLGLTPREQQVLELVEQGLRNKEIARDLGIRPGTVKIHLKHIFEKTGVRGRYGLALSGLREKVSPQMSVV